VFPFFKLFGGFLLKLTVFLIVCSAFWLETRSLGIEFYDNVIAHDDDVCA